MFHNAMWNVNVFFLRTMKYKRNAFSKLVAIVWPIHIGGFQPSASGAGDAKIAERSYYWRSDSESFIANLIEAFKHIDCISISIPIVGWIGGLFNDSR